MKTDVNLRFGSYALLMTAILGATAFCFYRYANLPPVFLLLVPLARRILGPSFKEWQESDHEISNRTLFTGFIVFLVLFWVGAITIAHYISPNHPAPYIIWAAVGGVLWALCLYPGYRWWRMKKRENNP